MTAVREVTRQRERVDLVERVANRVARIP